MLTTTLKFRSAFDQMANEDNFMMLIFVKKKVGRKRWDHQEVMIGIMHEENEFCNALF